MIAIGVPCVRDTCSRTRSRPTHEFAYSPMGVNASPSRDPRPVADYVLSDFEPTDDAEALVARAADAVEALDAEGLEKTQARFN